MPPHPSLAGHDLNALLVEHVADYAIYALDREGRVRSWTAGAARLKGWTEAEILGAHVSRFYTPEDVAAGVPERLLAAAADQGRAECQGWRVRRDGSRFWADVVITALRDESGALIGFAKLTRDLTERRAREEQALADARRIATEAAARQAAETRLGEMRDVQEELERQTEQLEEQAQELEEQAQELELQVAEARELALANERLLVEAQEAAARLSLLDLAVQATSEAVIITTAELSGAGPRVVFANPAYGAITQQRAQDAIGRPLRALLGIDAASPDTRRSQERLAAGEPARGVLQVVRADGERRAVEYRSAPVRGPGGGMEYLAVVMSDVTERVRLEEQYRQAQKMEALGQLAGGIAHDFNNVLTVIGASATFLAQAIPPDDPRRADVDEIRGAIERASGLTRQLLAFSRHQPFAACALDLSDVVLAAEKLLRRVLGENIELVTHAAPSLPPVLADRGQLEQVLLNLAVNARDAMPDGGRLEIATAAAADGGATLTVRDTGVGMSAETQSRIFDPFFTTKELGKGTGLGLSTVYGIVGRVGATIAVESAPGRGATFTVRFPRMDEPPSEAPEARRAGAESAGRGEAVLLVEDDDALRRVAARALLAAGYRVVDAPDGAVALELAAQLSRVDLLATDVIMPNMRGSVLAARMRERFPALRVLYMSGYTGDVEVERERREAGTSFLEKPYDGDTLARAARALLDA